jgi:hypothetical protein
MLNFTPPVQSQKLPPDVSKGENAAGEAGQPFGNVREFFPAFRRRGG